MCLLTLLLPLVTHAQEVRPIVFPVNGDYSFSNDFGDPRSGGRTHEGVDIITKKMTPLVSAVDGYISFLPSVEPSWGYAVYIQDNEGYSYRYLHMNNDTPGTDDGAGGPLYAYAPNISRGTRVVAGQLIGWAGDSGNAESVGSHLHFEIHTPNGTAINSYQSLLAASHPGVFDHKNATTLATSINVDKAIFNASSTVCQSDTLIKGALSAVYYCGADGRRYIFPNQNIYLSWYPDFSKVVQLTALQLANIPLGRNVTYRPGVRMVKIETDPKVYAVDKSGVLRHITTPEIAKGMYGSKWSTFVDDLPDIFFMDYHIGEPITALFKE